MKTNLEALCKRMKPGDMTFAVNDDGRILAIVCPVAAIEAGDFYVQEFDIPNARILGKSALDVSDMAEAFIMSHGHRNTGIPS